MSAKFFHSKGYKTVMNYVYGWGAAAVIIGALFKIMHFEGGGPILCVGMIVEAVIFFLSAFEPQPESYKWSKVFPELSGDAPANNGRSMSQNASAGVPLFDESDAESLREGIANLSKTANGIANISEAVVSTGKYSESMNAASSAVDNLNNVIGGLEKSVGGVQEGCQTVADNLAQTGNLMSEKISTKISDLTQTIENSEKEFERLGSLVGNYAGFVKQFEEKYQGTASNLNDNMSALNALYEMQLKGTNEYVEKFSNIQKNMHEMADNISLTLDNTRLHKSESEALGKNISSLNNVYGNMLSVLNNSKN